MKKRFFYTIILAFLFPLATSAQVTLNAESGNRAIEVGNCWQFAGQTYTSSTSEVLSGSFSLISGQMNSFSLTNSFIKTPWMKVGSGNITFIAKIGNQPNTVARGVRVSYIPYNAASSSTGFEGTLTTFYTRDFNINDLNTVTVIAPMPAAIANSTSLYKIMVSFVGQGGSGKIMSDNYIFPGTYWSNPSNSCRPLPLVVVIDTDGDGVPDAQDEYPNDPHRAYNSYFPSQTSFGTLAFEDNWPLKGDYDFNDVVMGYNIKTVTNAANQVVDLVASFRLLASGATFSNGFGFQIDGIAANKVSKVTGNKPGTMPMAANGIESGQPLATIIVFSNFFGEMVRPGVGIGVNTDKAGPYITPTNMQVVVNFINNGVLPPGGAVTLSQLNFSALNFFIFANGDRGTEIHLPDRAPTALANTGLFGSGDDTSSPGAGRTYKTSNNMPWAINIVQGFDYTKEKASINEAYNFFIDWASSGGASYASWFLNLPGYRNAELIY